MTFLKLQLRILIPCLVLFLLSCGDSRRTADVLREMFDKINYCELNSDCKSFTSNTSIYYYNKNENIEHIEEYYKENKRNISINPPPGCGLDHLECQNSKCKGIYDPEMRCL